LTQTGFDRERLGERLNQAVLRSAGNASSVAAYLDDGHRVAVGIQHYGLTTCIVLSLDRPRL
jgi:hypothetical protein